MLNKVLRILTVALGGTVAVTAATDSALAVTTSQQNSVAESNPKASAIKTDPSLGQFTDLLASAVPSELLYENISHTWVRVDGNRVVVGITDHAQEVMGDIVYVGLPEAGDTVNADDEMGVVESVKAASDIYAPVSGTVVSVNDELEDYPEYVNQDPYGEGWFIVIEMNDPSELDQLLDAADYSDHI